MNDQTIIDEQATATVNTADAKKHFAKNTLAALLFYAFNTITSIWMVPYQISHLGISNYGMVSLANNFGNYMQLFTIVLVGIIARFVAEASARGDEAEAKAYFNTQFIGITWALVVLLPLIALVSYFAPVLFVVPKGQSVNTQYLFFFVLLSFLVAVYTSLFQVGTFVKQRLDLRNAIEGLIRLVRCGSWIVLFNLFAPKLWQIGLGTLAGALAGLWATIYVFFKLTPQFKPSLRGFDKRKFITVTKSGGWMVVASLGMLFYYSADIFIVNRYLGPKATGQFGTIAQLAAVLRTLIGMLFNILTPPAIAFYAKQDWVSLMRLTARSVKFVSLSLAVLIGIICGLCVPTLTWWLGPKFVKLTPLMWLLLGHLVINLAMDMLSGITYTANAQVQQAAANVGGGVVKVVVAILMVNYTNLGLYGIAIADIIGHSLKNLVFAPLFSGYLMKQSSAPIYKAAIPAPIVFGATAGLAWWLSTAVNLASFGGLAAATIGIGTVAGIGAFFLALSRDERRFIAELTPLGKREKPA